VWGLLLSFQVEELPAMDSYLDEIETPRGVGGQTLASTSRHGSLFGRGRGLLSSANVSNSSVGMTSPPITVFAPPAVKVKKFFGDVEIDRDYDVEQFIEQVTLALDYQSNPARFVFNHLAGEARRELKTCGDGTEGPDAIFKILRAAFGEQRTLSELLQSFAHRSQTTKETVRHYANDLSQQFQKLCSKQVERKLEPFTEGMLIDKFLEGLRDRTLVMELRQQLKQGQKTFLELRSFAVEWEMVHLQHKAPEKGSRVCTNEVSATSHVEDKVEKLVKELAVLKAKMESLGRDETGQKDEGRGDRGRQMRCYRCHKFGHIAKHCPGNY
jgi:hypothetical protein